MIHLFNYWNWCIIIFLSKHTSYITSKMLGYFLKQWFPTIPPGPQVQIWAYFTFGESYFGWTYLYFEIRRILVWRIWRILNKAYLDVSTPKYDYKTYFQILIVIFWRILKRTFYTYFYMCYHYGTILGKSHILLLALSEWFSIQAK